MGNRRALIQMSQSELEEFLAKRHSMTLATRGTDQDIHLVAMWYGFLNGQLAFWTYAKSQKVVNLKRCNSIAILVETGSSYQELCGVQIVGDAEIIEEPSIVLEIGRSIYDRYVSDDSDVVQTPFMATAPKRVGVIIHPRKTISWDHHKLKGLY